MTHNTREGCNCSIPQTTGIEELKELIFEELDQYEECLTMTMIKVNIKNILIRHHQELQKAREEQRERDAYLIRTSGWHTAEKLARKILGGAEVNWYTQKQMDGRIKEAQEEERERAIKIIKDELRTAPIEVQMTKGIIFASIVGRIQSELDQVPVTN